jgi:hypothetical protein
LNSVINVICIKWGNVYNAEDVNKLHHMIKKNTNLKVDFYCFTENATDLDKDIIVKPLPVLNTIEEYQNKYAYKKEAGLCDDNLGGLNGQRVFFFDLDVLIVSNLDDLYLYPKENNFYIINDWNSKGNNIGQATCYSWVVGELGYIKEYYEKNPKEVVDKFYNASQEYLSLKVIEKYGKLNFWPEKWFCSFRFHCMPKFGPLRHFIAPSLPKNMPELKLINFHGYPKPKEAVEGIWKIKNGQIWKKIYKVCKPTPWITKYWE